MSTWNFTPSIPFMFFGTDVDGRDVYRVYNHPRKFVALGITDAEQMKVNRTINGTYTTLQHHEVVHPIFQMKKEDSQ